MSCPGTVDELCVGRNLCKRLCNIAVNEVVGDLAQDLCSLEQDGPCQPTGYKILPWSPSDKISSSRSQCALASSSGAEYHLLTHEVLKLLLSFLSVFCAAVLAFLPSHMQGHRAPGSHRRFRPSRPRSTARGRERLGHAPSIGTAGCDICEFRC